jgi:hypothetical protein
VHAKAATGGADDDFNEMLAEVTAADSQLPADIPASAAATPSITSSSVAAAAAVVVVAGAQGVPRQDCKCPRMRSSALASEATSLNFGDGGGKASVLGARFL